MTNRPSLPVHLTLVDTQGLRFQIHHDGNTPVVLSQLPQNQRVQENQSTQLEQPNGSVATDISLDMSSSEVHEQEANQPSTDSQNPDQTSRTDHSIEALRQFFEQNPGLSNFLKKCLTYIPFLILILLKEISKHTTEILVVLTLTATFVHGDSKLKREVSKQAKRDVGTLAIVSMNILACIALVNYLCGDKALYYTFLVFPEEAAPFTLTNLVWTVIATDLVLKLSTVLAKTVITGIPNRLYPPSRRGKWYVFIERSSQLYRALASVPPWIHYLFGTQTNQETAQESSLRIYSFLIGILLCAMYFTCKVYIAIELVKKWKTAFTKLLRGKNYGDSPNNEQLKNAEPICAICHESYKKPTLVPCKHIFCEECLALWLDREKTCPMCRSTVAEDPEWKDGSTTYLVQLF